MKYFVAFVFAAVVVALAAAEETAPKAQSTSHGSTSHGSTSHGHQSQHSGQTTKFTTKYDDVSLDEILKSDRLLQNYFDCLMDSKPCTPDGTELKKAIPLALKDDCAGCSDKQKSGAETVIKFLSDNKPELWHSLEDKYDPDRVYRTRHAEFAANKGIKV